MSDWIDDEVWNGGTCWDWKLSEMLKCNIQGSSRVPIVQDWMACDSFAYSLIHFFNKYVLISLCVLGRVPGAEDKTMSKTQTLF